MQKGIFANASPLTRLTLTATVVALCFSFFYFAGLLVARFAFHIDFKDLNGDLAAQFVANHAGAFQFLQIMQTTGMFIIPPFIVGYLIQRDAPSYLAMRSRTSIQAYLIAPVIIIASIPFINYLVSFNEAMHLPESLRSLETWMKESEKNAESLTQTFVQAKTWKQLGFNLFMIALLPAVGEELLFRGILQKQFTELTRNVHAGIWIAAAVFSFMHFQFYGFIPRLILGVLLGYVFFITGSLWIPILAHFTNNAITVIFYYLYDAGKIDNTAQEIGTTTNDLYIAFLSLAVVVLLMITLYLAEVRHRQSSTK